MAVQEDSMTAPSHRRDRSFFRRCVVATLTLLATIAWLAVSFAVAPAAGAAPKHAALATLVGVKK